MPNPSPSDTVEHARHAFLAWSGLTASARARAMVALADALDARRDEIIAAAAAETALFTSELAPEFARMTGTFRRFAEAVERGAWRICAIDHAQPAGAPLLVGPGHDVRRTLVPLGPVAVFGASNFPLAYGVCGGDTASALGAGCSVVVKEHPAHPGTGRLIHSIAAAALCGAGAPGAGSLAGVLSYVRHEDPNDHGVAQQLVQHPAVAAVGFTGSIPGGLAVERLARERSVPIPVFAEMGSVNPVFITPGAMRARAEEIADLIADAVLARHGQQCTCPGVVFFEDCPGAVRFTNRVRGRWEASAPRDMLAAWVRSAYDRRAEELRAAGASLLASGRAPGSTGRRAAGALLWSSTLEGWNADATVRGECFGPSLILVPLRSWSGAERAVLGGNLTLSLFLDRSDPADVSRVRRVLASHVACAGRIVYNGVPTGVRVCPAMVHSGPFPACNRPDTTAVGPNALTRWCRPVCHQNCPQELLPPELQDAGAPGTARYVDGRLRGAD